MTTANETKSSRIRALAASGMATADIARTLGIRYQHARKVLVDAGLIVPKTNGVPAASKPDKPELSCQALLAGGFQLVTSWRITEDGGIMTAEPLPKDVGVYAFGQEDKILYVGVATMGLRKRIYFYAKPGPRQRTSQRLNGLIKAELTEHRGIDIYLAFPEHGSWNGLPVHGSAGLELGLIKAFKLPWNMRSNG